MSPSFSDSPSARVLRQMADAVGIADSDDLDGDSFVGYFQTFRPDGRGLTGVFDGLGPAAALQSRLDVLFEVAGDDRRPQGGRDAYFVVRKPRPIDPDQVQAAGDDWIARLMKLASELGRSDVAERIALITRVRVLEGLPPKNPRLDVDKTMLFRCFHEDVPAFVAGIEGVDAIAPSLRTPYYYITCDPYLRDHLMWPLYASHVNVEEPFEPYFLLWRHGVKFRIYQDDQLDLYMPRLG